MGWNQCDVCGRFDSFENFYSGLASRKLVTPDSEFTSEEYETLCKEHNHSSSRESEVKNG